LDDTIVANFGTRLWLILQYGGTNDIGGLKITDDGIAMWGAGNTDLLRVNRRR